MNIQEQIGKNLRVYRNKKNLSLESLIHELRKRGFQVSITTLSSWENGKTPIHSAFLVMLAKCLDIEVQDLFAGVEESTKRGE